MADRPGLKVMKQMTTDDAPSRRLLIVAGCYADAAPAISLAEALSGRLVKGLVGVLAREPAAEAAEGAPVLSAQRPRTTGSAVTRERLSAAYAADARAFSARLSLIATRSRMTWEFRTDSGMTSDLACRFRQPDDLVLVGYRRLLDTGGPVIALCREEDRRTQQLAAALARALKRRALVLPIETADQIERIEAMSATALILAPELAVRSGWLAALVEAARCPVLIAPDEG